MSKFLGPIHHWLYHKIQVQQEFIQEIVEVAKSKYQLDLEDSSTEKYGIVEKGPLEEGSEKFEKLEESTFIIRKKTGVEIMVQEHENIARMLVVVRKVCAKILKGEAICFEDFDTIVDFIRNYADTHHHGKEELFLFKAMEEHLGELGVKLIRNGMLVEHDLGRLYSTDLVEAVALVKAGNEESKLDVIANAIGYTHLLERHIAKENEVVYTFGERKLPMEVLEDINKKTRVFEENAALDGIQRKYIGILEVLENKYK